jgi:hypothetical protein
LRSIFSESESKIVSEFDNLEKIWNSKPLGKGFMFYSTDYLDVSRKSWHVVVQFRIHDDKVVWT